MRVSKLDARTVPEYKLSLSQEELEKLWHLTNCSENDALARYMPTSSSVSHRGADEICTFKSLLWQIVDEKIRSTPVVEVVTG